MRGRELTNSSPGDMSEIHLVWTLLVAIEGSRPDWNWMCTGWMRIVWDCNARVHTTFRGHDSQVSMGALEAVLRIDVPINLSTEILSTKLLYCVYKMSTSENNHKK